MGSTIIGCGKSLPKLEVANDELKALVDTNDEWISTRTGIRSRHVAVEETATDLAEAAARQALGLADGGWREDGEAIDPASIDLVIYATITPDVLVPSAAGLLRRRLGLENAIAFDLNAACTGFVYGLTVAECMMAGSTAGAPGAAGRNPVRRALVVGAERLTRVTGWSDRNTCVLFGDGAGAAVLEWNENRPGIVCLRRPVAVRHRRRVARSPRRRIALPYRCRAGHYRIRRRGRTAPGIAHGRPQGVQVRRRGHDHGRARGARPRKPHAG